MHIYLHIDECVNLCVCLREETFTLFDGVNFCLFGSLPPAAEEDAGSAGQDPGADAARTKRELLNLPQRR